MDNAGLKAVTMYLLKNARHDVLHEEKSDGAAETRKILTEWITQTIA